MANGSQISTSVSIISSLLGFQALSLSNMNTSAATVITAGSKVEIKSAFFNFSTDLTPNASSWTAIATANTAYLTLLPSGTAGSQIVSASWSVTAPVWSDSAQGWYLTAGSSIRYIGGCHKGGATSYQNKFLLDSAAMRDIRQRVYSLGAWDMQTTASVLITHNLSDIKKILFIRGSVSRDDGANAYIFSGGKAVSIGTQQDLVVDNLTLSVISILRTSGGFFDSAVFSSTAVNRGYIIVEVLV